MAGKTVKETIHAKGFDISIYTNDFENEFISLTDIARYKSEDANATICNWMRNRETLELFGYFIYFRKKYSLINGFEADMEGGRKNEAYAKRVGMAEFVVGIGILAAGIALIIFA